MTEVVEQPATVRPTRERLRVPPVEEMRALDMNQLVVLRTDMLESVNNLQLQLANADLEPDKEWLRRARYARAAYQGGIANLNNVIKERKFTENDLLVRELIQAGRALVAAESVIPADDDSVEAAWVRFEESVRKFDAIHPMRGATGE